jgi:hypothetical protein
MVAAATAQEGTYWVAAGARPASPRGAPAVPLQRAACPEERAWVPELGADGAGDTFSSAARRSASVLAACVASLSVLALALGGR